MTTTSTAHAQSPVIESLQQVLATTYALAVKTHAAHWNVTGPQFYSLHEAFGSQYEALLEAADDVAERIRALGAPAPSGIGALSAQAGIQDLAVRDGVAIAAVLAADHRALSRTVAAAVKIAQEASDEATADLLIGRIEVHDKTAWMLAAIGG